MTHICTNFFMTSHICIVRMTTKILIYVVFTSDRLFFACKFRRHCRVNEFRCEEEVILKSVEKDTTRYVLQVDVLLFIPVSSRPCLSIYSSKYRNRSAHSCIHSSISIIQSEYSCHNVHNCPIVYSYIQPV